MIILKNHGRGGAGDEQIKENLLRAGWIKENIDRGFNSILIQNLVLKSKGEGQKDKQIIENLISSKYDKNDIYDAYDYLVKKLGRKIMPRYYILWMPFFHRLRYRADIHSYIFKQWGFLNPISGKLISTKTPIGKLIVGILLIFIVWFVVSRLLSISSTVPAIKTELSRMSGSKTSPETTQTITTSPISITESTTKQKTQTEITNAETSKTISPISLTSLEKNWRLGYQFWVDSDLSWDELGSVMVYKGTLYSKYKDEVYYDATKLNADPITFQVLGSCGFQGIAAFAKDKSHVYTGSNIVESVDVSTFELVGSFDIASEGMPIIYCVTKDKNCIYHYDKKVLDANGVCISPISCTKDTLASSCGFK